MGIFTLQKKFSAEKSKTEKLSRLRFIPKDSADINSCRNPQCSNFLVPPEYPDEPVPLGPFKKKNGLYSRIGNIKGTRLKCNICGESLPIKSGKGLSDELERIKTQPTLKLNNSGCPNNNCDNHGVNVNAGNQYYYKHGLNKVGNPRYKCKSCNKTFVVNTNPLQRQRITHLNKTIFKLLVNKSPTQRIMEITDLNAAALYGKIDFIYKQCVLFARDRESRLPQLLKGRDLCLATDVQHHLVNWTKRKDKRNTQFQAIATACNDTSYVFGSHLNYDPTIQQSTLEQIVNERNEAGEEPAFRETARYWIYPDYLKATSRVRYGRKKNSQSTVESIQNTYIEAADRDNIDASFSMDEFLKLPDKGSLIHSDYTMLAHFRYINELTEHAKHVLHSMDQDSGIRAAFMLGYRERLSTPKLKKVDGFYVKFMKLLTVDEKRELYGAAERYLKNFAANNGITELEAKHKIVSDNILNAMELGQWSDKWVNIPTPSMGEPEKMVCYLNNQGQHSDRKLPWLHLKASLHSIDRYFMQIRRMIHYLERPVKSATSSGNMWNGYNAYNPEMVVKLLEIFRVYYNFCKKGKDGQTPAQRIGLSKGINDVEDILYFHPNANIVRKA